MPVPATSAGCPFRRLAGPALMVAGAVLLLAAGPRQAGAQAPDCGAVGPAAGVVCANPALVQLARETQDAFRELVRSVSRDDRPAVMREQRDWSFSLGQCLNGAPVDCLRQAYEDRISVLIDAIGGQIGGQSGGQTLSVEPPTAVEQRTLPAPEGVASPNRFGSPAGPRGTTAAAGPDQTPADAGDQASGAERGTGPVQTASRTPAQGESADTSSILTGTVWKAEIASGIRPGTIFVFNGDGGLVTADCVESYRIGTWQLNSDGTLVLNEGNATSQTAEIVSIRDRFVRLQLRDAGSPTGAGRTLVLRPAVAPFSCRSG